MEGLSLEKQVELMSEVIHNHSNEISEINDKCYKSFGMVEDDINWLVNRENEIDMTLAKEMDKLSGSISSVGVWTFLGFLGAGVLGYFGYKAWENHEERLSKLEKGGKTVHFEFKKEADDTVENPKMAEK